MSNLHKPRPPGADFEPLRWVDEIWELSPSGLRVEAMREVGRALNAKLQASRTLEAVRTCVLMDFLYPRAYGLWQVDAIPVPFILLRHQMLVVQFLQAGSLKTLLFNPTEYAGAISIPLVASLRQRLGPFLARRMVTQHRSPLERLQALGLRPEQVDYIAFDHLLGQDLRRLLGTNEQDGEPALQPMFPNATLLVQARELAALKSPHPLHRIWIVPHAMERVRHSQIQLLDGSYSIGEGVALVWTPGHTAGSQSLALRTPSGVAVVTANGVAPDCYSPAASRIRSLRRLAADGGPEFVLNGNVFESATDQYASMALEFACADISRENEHFRYVYPSSAFVASLLSPGLRPYGNRELSFGDLVGARQERCSTNEVPKGSVPVSTV